MIINYPTGLYSSVLPVNPQDGGNITFTISNTTPPRTNLVFPKIPAGLVDRGRNRPQPISSIDNRQYLGELIYSVSSSRRRTVGNNSRQYEIGQVLDFNTSDTVAVDVMLVSQITEIQHNTNIFDYDQLGVTSDEQDLIAAESLKKHSILTDQLNDIKRARADAEIDINTQQKIINEANRAIAAMQAIASNDLSSVIVKLQVTRDQAIKVRDAAIAAANSYSAQADAVLAQLRSVAVVLK